MKVLIVGGTGFVGKVLMLHLLSKGYQVMIVTRNLQKAQEEIQLPVEMVEWNNSFTLTSPELLTDVDAVVNLAGESIGTGRWTRKKKEQILNSRIKTTETVVNFIKNGWMKPNVLINASAIGYYGSCHDQEIFEADLPGEGFLANVSKRWEEEASKAEEFNIRVVPLRIGVVLGQEGALQKMVFPYRFYMGGTIGSGEQWLSWIHIHDLVQMIHFIIQNEEIKGPINATSPKPIRMKEFNRLIGKVSGKPSWLPVPSWILYFLLGEMADMLVQGQRVFPKKIMQSGFQFQFEEAEAALKSILKN